MSDSVFHCSECKRLGPGDIRPQEGTFCLGCGCLLTSEEIKVKVSPVRKSGSKMSESGRGETRRRTAVMVGERDHVEETKRANYLVLSSLVVFLLAGISFAGYKWYGAYKAEQRLAKAPGVEEVSGKLSSYVKIESKDEAATALRKLLVDFITAYYKEPLATNRLAFIDDSGILASRFENFYIHHSDKPDLDDLELLGVYQTRLPEQPMWVARMRFGSEERDIVVVNTEDGLRINWLHLVAPSLDDWAGFIKQESRGEKVFRVYAWLVKGGSDSDTMLLRMASPMFAGGTELAEVSPILRIPVSTDLGKRLFYLFNELPEDENEIGFPRGFREDDKMRKLTVRIRTEGQVNKNPALVLEEIIAGDWVELPPDERVKLAEARKVLEADTEPIDDKIEMLPESSSNEDDKVFEALKAKGDDSSKLLDDNS